MRDFIATFHTHLSAMMTCRSLRSVGYAARMAPVPRSLSSSCGTCVFYSAPEPCKALMDEDTERVYEVHGTEYELLLELEA